MRHNGREARIKNGPKPPRPLFQQSRAEGRDYFGFNNLTRRYDFS